MPLHSIMQYLYSSSRQRLNFRAAAQQLPPIAKQTNFSSKVNTSRIFGFLVLQSRFFFQSDELMIRRTLSGLSSPLSEPVTT